MILGGLGVYALSAVGFYAWGKQRHDQATAEISGGLPTEVERLHTFDALAKGYDDDVGWDEWLSGINGKRKMLAGRAKGRVLEVAVGTGRNLEYYTVPKVVQLTLVDKAPAMLDITRGKLASRSAPLLARLSQPPSVMQADGQSLPFEAGSFDTVVDTFGLCSIEDPVAALREWQRVLAADGEILLLEHGQSSWSWISSFLDRGLGRHVHRFGCFWNRDIAEIVREAGLEIVEESRSNFGTTYYFACRAGPGAAKTEV